MFENTKHDLSFDTVVLDYDALIQTARIAFAHSRDQVGRHMRDTYDMNPNMNYTSASQSILRQARHMVTAAETLHALQEGLTRSQLEIVNKPEVKDE